MAKAAMRDLHRFDSYVVIGRSQATGFAVLAFVCVWFRLDRGSTTELCSVKVAGLPWLFCARVQTE